MVANEMVMEGEDPPSTAAVSMGTTLIALKYNGGVVLACDTRTSSGPIITNRASAKITKVADSIFVMRSGNAAHTEFIAQLVKNYLFQHQIEMCSNGGAAVRKPTVKSAASLGRLIVYNNQDSLTAGLIVGGWDKEKGPQLFRIMGNGSIIEQDFLCSGTGSAYVYGLADASFRKDMSKEEAAQLAIKLVHHAILRDCSSGGMIRTVTVDETGSQESRILGKDIAPLRLTSAIF